MTTADDDLAREQHGEFGAISSAWLASCGLEAPRFTDRRTSIFELLLSVARTTIVVRTPKPSLASAAVMRWTICRTGGRRWG
jgi:hypothetical protein